MDASLVSVAIDFGTSGTSAVITPSHTPSLVIPISLDSSTSRTTKVPTCILVSATPPHIPLAFGWDALVQSRDREGLLFVEFKMQLRPGGLLVGRGEPNAFRVNDTTGREWPLLVPVVRFSPT